MIRPATIIVIALALASAFNVACAEDGVFYFDYVFNPGESLEYTIEADGSVMTSKDVSMSGYYGNEVYSDESESEFDYELESDIAVSPLVDAEDGSIFMELDTVTYCGRIDDALKVAKDCDDRTMGSVSLKHPENVFFTSRVYDEFEGNYFGGIDRRKQGLDEGDDSYDLDPEENLPAWADDYDFMQFIMRTEVNVPEAFQEFMKNNRNMMKQSLTPYKLLLYLVPELPAEGKRIGDSWGGKIYPLLPILGGEIGPASEVVYNFEEFVYYGETECAHLTVNAEINLAHIFEASEEYSSKRTDNYFDRNIEKSSTFRVKKFIVEIEQDVYLDIDNGKLVAVDFSLEENLTATKLDKRETSSDVMGAPGRQYRYVSKQETESDYIMFFDLSGTIEMAGY